MDAGGSKDRVRLEAGWRCEHRLRNEISRVGLAISLARSAHACGDQETLGEMLAEAEDAAKGCRDAMGSLSATVKDLAASTP